MEFNIIRLIPILIMFILLYKLIDFLYKKSLKESIINNKVDIRIRNYTNAKLKLARNAFIISIFLYLFLIIYEIICII